MQTLANHARFVPAFHYFAVPVLLINSIVALVAAWRNPSLATGWGVVVAAALMTAAVFARTFALTAQDRLIRLEETLRMQRVLPASAHGDIAKLTRFQYVALRFASDEELPELVRRAAAGEFATPADIKKAVRNWRPDLLRV
jgi:Family of unknown function (DUF6526)